jgi:ribonuclease R
MAQAVYTPENSGHFGLAYPAYTHFTSPIRRYPDLLVHRAIRAMIHSDSQARTIGRPDDFVQNPAFRYAYTTEQVVQLGEHCSMSERRADDATRDVEAWLKCEFMQDQVGHEYDGVVSAVTGFGLFIELESVYIEGLVHITGLPSDYYHFDAAKQRLVGERTRKVFKLGDRLRVQVARVDLDDRKIDFELVKSLESGQVVKAKVSQRQLLAEGKIGATGERAKPKSAHGRGKPKAKANKHQGSVHKKSHMSAAERELAALSKGAEGKSKKAKKRRAKKPKKALAAKSPKGSQ